MQTPFILMMAFGYLVLFVAIGVQVVLALVLLRESSKLDKAAAVHVQYTALAAKQAALAKDQAALDDLMQTMLSRNANRIKQKRKEERQEQEQLDLPAGNVIGGVEFPSLQ